MTTSVAPAPVPVVTAGRGVLVGWRGLLRLALRADRFRIVVWAVVVAWLVLASVRAFDSLYVDAAARQARAELIASPAATALAGPGFGLDDYTVGAMTANELGLWIMIPVAIMAVLAVTRHLRAPEEDGRSELVRSQPVGRDAPVVAGLVAAVVAVVAVGAATFVLLIATDLEPAGSAVLCAAVVVVGLVFAAVSAVAAQVAGSARGASALGLAAIGVTVVLRAVGDARGPRSTSVLTWLSPFGWSQATAPWVLDRWWPLLVGLAATVVLVGLAFALVARRDHGSGLLPARVGRAHGRLGTLVGLAWRRQRTSLVAWSVAIVLTALLVGAVAGSVAEFVESDSAIAELFPAGSSGAVASATAMYTAFLAVLAAACAGTVLGAARGEEDAGRVGHLLALPVSRTRWLVAQVGLAALVVVLTMLVAGLVMGVAADLSLGESGWVGELVGAAAVQSVGALAVLGVAVVVLGWAPRWYGVVWAYVAYTGVVTMFGAILPDGTDVLSPFAALPRLPAQPMHWPPVLMTLVLALLVSAAGAAAYRHRDLTA